MTKIFQARTSGYQSNCYLLLTDGAAAVVDPSVPLEAFSLPDGTVPTHILLTHGHFDHILALQNYVERFHCPVYLAQADAELLSDPYKNASALFGLPPVYAKIKTVPVAEGNILPLGEGVTVLETPGHTAGSVCYRTGDTLFTGDTVFCGGVGRCDLYGGSEESLRRSLRQLTALPGDFRIFPGHGEETRLSAEKDRLFLNF